jgi:hypothetical protein
MVVMVVLVAVAQAGVPVISPVVLVVQMELMVVVEQMEWLVAQAQE